MLNQSTNNNANVNTSAIYLIKCYPVLLRLLLIVFLGASATAVDEDGDSVLHAAVAAKISLESYDLFVSRGSKL